MVNYSNYPPNWIEKIDREILFSVNNGLPGAVVSISVKGKNIFHKAYGHQKLYNEREVMPVPEIMQTSTLFDLASLTKIFSTTFSYMKLVDDKTVSLDDKVCTFLPEFSGGQKSDVTVKQLLHHNSGLPSSMHFYNPSSVSAEFYSQSRNRTIELAPKLLLTCPPGTKTIYSDLNFLLLGIILEKITGCKQDMFVSHNIYAPLGLNNTGYMLADNGIPLQNFAATERCGNTRDGNVSFPNIRTETLQGQVQDELAFYSMEQVSGNSGLFSNVDDLTVLSQLILNGGQYGTFKLCSQETMNTFTQSKNIDGSYMFGFQNPTENTRLIYGALLPDGGHAVGHTGWTGNCFLVDFNHNAIIIILTNKKHSPVISLPTNYNIFEGDLMPASIYGGIIQLFYGGLLSHE